MHDPGVDSDKQGSLCKQCIELSQTKRAGKVENLDRPGPCSSRYILPDQGVAPHGIPGPDEHGNKIVFIMKRYDEFGKFILVPCLHKPSSGRTG